MAWSPDPGTRCTSTADPDRQRTGVVSGRARAGRTARLAGAQRLAGHRRPPGVSVPRGGDALVALSGRSGQHLLGAAAPATGRAVFVGGSGSVPADRAGAAGTTESDGR